MEPSPVAEAGRTAEANSDGQRSVPGPTERVLVIIPAFNEGGRVGAVVRDVRAAMPRADVLVVDDGSRDTTSDEASVAGARLMRLPVNMGYGAALQAGYKYAVRHDYHVVGQIDADGQHRASDLPRLMARLHQADTDVAVGSRFLDTSGHYRPSRARKAGIALFARIASMVMKQPVSDPTSGLQMMQIGVARFFCSEVYPMDYPDADILILLHRSGFWVREVPVEMLPSVRQSMHSGHRSFYYVYKMCLSILVTLLRPRSAQVR
jgi:glycosyltransferase involved in cell wall biosynthesis